MITQEEIDGWLKQIEEAEAAAAEEAKGRGKKRPGFTLLHEDSDLLVVDKAPGVPTIPERDPAVVSLRDMLIEQFGQVWTVHRIDKDTSGLVLFARNEEAHRELSRQFQEREVEKVYLAIAEGEPSEESFEVDIPLGKAPGNRMKPSASGKESFTRFEVATRFRGFTLLRAYPKTGRQHQIRVHASAIGLPLLVDHLYGDREEFFLSTIKRKYRDYGREERPLIGRLTLHAHGLSFSHPSTGERVSYEVDPPKDFRAVLNQLNKVRPYDV